MNTPTPRTDAAWSATFNGEQMSAGQTARTLREHSRQLEAELAALTAERDQLLAILVSADQILDDIDTCSDAHKPMYSTYSQNVFKLCIKDRDARRAAIAKAEGRA